MTTGLASLVENGTKVWSDSVDPKVIERDLPRGITGATSNPVIVADLIRTGRFDQAMRKQLEQTADDHELAWQMTDQLVSDAQQTFAPIWEQTGGNDGYVSFELDPLLEDPDLGPPYERVVAQYIELGKRWSAGHTNRLIKVPATAAGLDALEDLAAASVPLNVTLVFTQRQYEAAREAIWRGIQRAGNHKHYKSVYSIFISRLDVYTQKHVPELSEAAQGWVGTVNAKRLWWLNQRYWRDKGVGLDQEIVFASTGTKLASDPPDKYVEALVGSDIQTNPPETNQAVEELGKRYSRTIDQMPDEAVLEEIDRKVDMAALERVLMQEGVKKFADPQKSLLEVIEQKRASLATTG